MNSTPDFPSAARAALGNYAIGEGQRLDGVIAADPLALQSLMSVTGSVPVPGWDGAADWTGYVPFDKLPRLLDPPGGAIVTANNAPTGAAYPYFLGREWDAGARIFCFAWLH